MTELILSLRSDIQGTWAAAYTVDGELVRTARERHPLPRRVAGFLSLRGDALVASLLRTTLQLLSALEPRQRSRVVALGITTPRDTAVLIGSENQQIAPVLFGAPPPLPGSDVPEPLRSDARASSVYRSSVVRVVRERLRDLAEVPIVRVVSLGALLHNALSGHWVDNRDCLVGTAPARNGAPSDDALDWEAFGHPAHQLSMHVPAGGIAAQVAPHVARRLGLPSGTPIVSTGSAAACGAYAFGADVAGWYVELEDGLRATFVGPRASRGTYSVEIRDEGLVESSSSVPAEVDGDGAVELAPAQAAWVVLERLGERLRARPGPTGPLTSYQIGTVQGLIDGGGLGLGALPEGLGVATPHERSLVATDLLQRVPIGANGVRGMFGAATASVVGLRPGHGRDEIWRAVLEGLALELGRWRMLAGVLGSQPPRLVVRRPWERGVAQLVANVLGERLAVWQGEPELPSLYGQARAIAELGEVASWDPKPLVVVEPDEQAEGYRAVRSVHVALAEILAPVLH